MHSVTKKISTIAWIPKSLTGLPPVFSLKNRCPWEHWIQTYKSKQVRPCTGFPQVDVLFVVLVTKLDECVAAAKGTEFTRRLPIALKSTIQADFLINLHFENAFSNRGHPDKFYALETLEAFPNQFICHLSSPDSTPQAATRAVRVPTTLPNEFHVWHCQTVPAEDRVIDPKGPTKPACPWDHQAATTLAFVNTSGDHW